MDFHDYFEDHSLFFSRLGFENDPPRFENGKLVEFHAGYEACAELHGKLHGAGVKVHTSLLFSGWVGPDQYDYTLTDETLKAFFTAVPDGLYLARVKLNAPVEWQREHPEDLLVYWGGEREGEVLRKKVGTAEHDLLGYDSPEGYWLDKRPNVGGMFSNQSFSSDAWLADATKALIAFMDHVMAGPYRDRIIGFHIGYGACGETCWWGRCSTRHGDYSHVFQQGFLDWGIQKYGSEEARRRAWGTDELPSPEQLILASPKSLQAYLRQRPQDRICQDRDLYASERNAQVAESFCRTVKEHYPDKCAGVFYGYIMECSNANYTGWLDLERLLSSPYVDFLAAPCSYYRRGEGDAGGYIVPAESVNRKKIFLDELDVRTYLATRENATGIHVVPKNCTLSVLCREMSKNLCAGSGFWWMDLGGTYYNSEYVLQAIRQVESWAATVRSMKRHSTADILVLVSEDSMWQHTESASLFQAYHRCERELALAGGISQTYRLRDLPELDLSSYRLIVLRDCVSLSAEEQALLRSFPGVVLYTYADGLADVQLPGRHPLSGITLRETEEPYPAGEVSFCGVLSGCRACPQVTVPRLVPELGPEVSVHGRFGDGSPAVVSADGRHFHSMLPLLGWPQFRALLEVAGCRTYGQAPCVAYGDSAFTAVFDHEHPEQFTFEIAGQGVVTP